MRIVVVSDSHGDYSAVEDVFLRNSDADWLLHLGDGESDVDQFVISYPTLANKVIHVAGNCDFNSMSHDVFTLPAMENKIFMTHGHLYGVKSSLEHLKNTAKEQGCNIVLYGHTHSAFMKYEDGLYIMNPGSVSCPYDEKPASFGHIDISPSGIVMNIADVAPLR